MRVAHAMLWLNKSRWPAHTQGHAHHPRWLELLQARSAYPAHAVRGVLYAHMDFWVLPYALPHALSLDRVWLLHGGVAAGRGCVTGSQVTSTHGWWCGANSSGWAAMRKIERKGLLPASWPDQMLCPGWSDLFYVPITHANEYEALASIFWQHHVVNELSTHTILTLLASSRGGKPDYLRCAGGALGQFDPYEIGLHSCGHRLDFRDIQQAAALEAALLHHRGALANMSCSAARARAPSSWPLRGRRPMASSVVGTSRSS